MLLLIYFLFNKRVFHLVKTGNATNNFCLRYQINRLVQLSGNEQMFDMGLFWCSHQLQHSAFHQFLPEIARNDIKIKTHKVL